MTFTFPNSGGHAETQKCTHCRQPHSETGHYTIKHWKDGDGAMADLREIKPDAMNLVLFSTSGVHGSYRTIEEALVGVQWDAEGRFERRWCPECFYDGKEHTDEGEHCSACGDLHFVEWLPSVTVLLFLPRLVSMTCGNVNMRSKDDVKFLKALRQKSWDAMVKIGAP